MRENEDGEISTVRQIHVLSQEEKKSGVKRGNLYPDRQKVLQDVESVV